MNPDHGIVSRNINLRSLINGRINGQFEQIEIKGINIVHFGFRIQFCASIKDTGIKVSDIEIEPIMGNIDRITKKLSVSWIQKTDKQTYKQGQMLQRGIVLFHDLHFQ
eukprot:TRINITY_DN41432_c0_g1_i1.p2 TRINITY_DN41432_c0_g1~~TRINITY_DN41432_c0_g1_i1.p2  ORF type:complete len:108 (-),score=1.11 TRINITY_DN41432_c0_g1_i1:30-353(-)